MCTSRVTLLTKATDEEAAGTVELSALVTNGQRRRQKLENGRPKARVESMQDGQDEGLGCCRRRL